MDGDIKHDIAIVGGGWSAASVTYHLIERILESNQYSQPLNILIFEKTENLWTGVPYGNFSRKDFFLIETLNQAKFPLFESWLKKNGSFIAGLLPENSEPINEWYKENKYKILQGDIDDVYFPRHIFGFFVRELLNFNLVRARPFISVSYRKEEVVDIKMVNHGYEIQTDKSNYLSEKVVLAMGSIPKFSESQGNNYFSDKTFCACFDYAAIFVAIAASNDKSLAVIGASASALELLYCISNNHDLMKEISVIHVISKSGRLLDGYTASDYSDNDAPEYVLQRRSSDVYKSSVERLKPKLRITKGSVTTIKNRQNAIHIGYSKENGTINDRELIVDVAVNCTGSSSVDNTSSTLIKNLAKILPVTEERRGFQVNHHNEVIGFPGLFINGPLLNRNFSNRQVENIPAVFKESAIIAKQLLVACKFLAEIE